MSTSAEIAKAVSNEENLSPLIPRSYLDTPPLRFDFSKQNPEIKNVDMTSVADLQKYVDETLAKTERTWGIGGYMENRFFYEKSELFKSGNEFRSIHLGIDLWLPANTEIYAPLDARVHSFHNNANFLDYGPTIILEHNAGGITFYTLYGHLSAESLEGLAEGKTIAGGERVAWLGAPPVNGSWPPHLHFQVIGDLEGKKGDYPGVAVPSEKNRYMTICPDPEILLKPFLKA
jgi:peptidoglycan LD-endopeptidase LytH